MLQNANKLTSRGFGRLSPAGTTPPPAASPLEKHHHRAPRHTPRCTGKVVASASSRILASVNRFVKYCIRIVTETENRGFNKSFHVRSQELNNPSPPSCGPRRGGRRKKALPSPSSSSPVLVTGPPQNLSRVSVFKLLSNKLDVNVSRESSTRGIQTAAGGWCTASLPSG